jgi:transcriptional regulator with XRE-family HTH domain/quercetin dioxygenase-like cupin family protein
MFDIGEKLRAARHSRNMTLRELAAKVDLSASLLSQIETGKTNPSVMSLYNIAAVLEMPVDYFFPTSGAPAAEAAVESHVVAATASELRMTQSQASGAELRFEEHPHSSPGPVVRAAMRAKIELMGGVTWERLTPRAEEHAEFLAICYSVGADSGPAMSHHSGREFTLVIEGELLLELGFERYLLTAGDSFIFDSTTPHRLSNPGPVPMRAISVIFTER